MRNMFLNKKKQKQKQKTRQQRQQVNIKITRDVEIIQFIWGLMLL